MSRPVTPANAIFGQHGIKVRDIALGAGVSQTSMALVAAGKWKASDDVAEAVVRVARIKGLPLKDAEELRDEWLARCDAAWETRHGEVMSR